MSAGNWGPPGSSPGPTRPHRPSRALPMAARLRAAPFQPHAGQPAGWGIRRRTAQPPTAQPPTAQPLRHSPVGTRPAATPAAPGPGDHRGRAGLRAGHGGHDRLALPLVLRLGRRLGRGPAGSAAPGRVDALAAEGTALAIVQLLSAVLLVGAGVWALNRRARAPGGCSWRPSAVQLVLAALLAVRLTVRAGRCPTPGGTIIAFALFFAAGPLVGLGMLLVGPGRRWFDGADRPPRRPDRAARQTGGMSAVPASSRPARPRGRRAAAPRPGRAGGRRRPAARHRRGADGRVDGRRGPAPHPHHRPGDVLVAQPRGVLGQGRDLRQPSVGPRGAAGLRRRRAARAASTRRARPATPASAAASTGRCLRSREARHEVRRHHALPRGVRGARPRRSSRSPAGCWPTARPPSASTGSWPATGPARCCWSPPSRASAGRGTASSACAAPACSPSGTASPQWLGDDVPGLTDDLPADPLAAVRTLARRLRSPRAPGLPPLTGGLVGYLGYDVVRRLERLPRDQRRRPRHARAGDDAGDRPGGARPHRRLGAADRQRAARRARRVRGRRRPAGRHGRRPDQGGAARGGRAGARPTRRR